MLQCFRMDRLKLGEGLWKRRACRQPKLGCLEPAHQSGEHGQGTCMDRSQAIPAQCRAIETPNPAAKPPGEPHAVSDWTEGSRSLRGCMQGSPTRDSLDTHKAYAKVTKTWWSVPYIAQLRWSLLHSGGRRVISEPALEVGTLLRQGSHRPRRGTLHV